MSAQSDAEWGDDDARYRSQMIGRLMLEIEQMLQALHECALAENRVRALHHAFLESKTDHGYCDVCVVDDQSLHWPCPTIRALEVK